MNPNLWRGRRVFITGHTGFKGSWLSLWLQSLGADLIGYALPPPTRINLFTEAQVAKDMLSLEGDVRDLPLVLEAMKSARPEVVIHMAAQPLVRTSYDHPVETYATNVMGTVHVLEAARNTESVRAIVNVTTDKCYENRDWVWPYRESDRLGGYDPYSNSKACAELVTSAFVSSFFNPSDYARHRCAVATVRAGNVIGGGDWAEGRLIPDVLTAFEAGRPIRLRNPNAIRPWQHVLEPLRGYMMLAERLLDHGTEFAGAWNFGPDDTDCRPVSWVVTRLAERWGCGARWILDNDPQPHEANCLQLDISKAQARLGWRPHWGLDTALARIVTWHQSRLRGADLRAVCLEQIQEFSQSLGEATTRCRL